MGTRDRSCRQVRNGNENLKKEIRCIKLVKHTNVIKLFDTVDEEDSDKVYLIFELANLLSLQDLCELVREKGIKDPITEVENKWLPIPYIRILFEQLVQGLLACHSKASAGRASRCPPPLSRKSFISLPCSGSGPRDCNLLGNRASTGVRTRAWQQSAVEQSAWQGECVRGSSRAREFQMESLFAALRILTWVPAP